MMAKSLMTKLDELKAPPAQPEPLTTWPNPEPITTKLESLPYPANELPKSVLAAVNEVYHFVQAPYPIVASCALSALSAAIQGLIDIERTNGLKSCASLFLLSIADSGERKTTCDAYFTQSIRIFDREQRELAEPDLKQYAAEIAAWEAQKSGLVSEIKSKTAKGDSSKVKNLRDDLIDLERNKPEPPRVPRIMLGDETPESLVWRLAKEYPSAAIISSEAGSILGAHGMGKESVMRNLATLNTLWDGGSISIGRKTSESFTMEGARLTVSLQVQETTLRGFVDRSGELARGMGFFARDLIANPESTQGNRKFVEAPKDWPCLSAFNNRINEILHMPLNIVNGRLEPILLKLSPEAKQEWISFLNQIESEIVTGGELANVRDVASKIADNAARMAALFHVFEHGVSGTVSAENFNRASAICLWHLSESRKFFGEISLPVELSNAVRLDDWLIKYCKQDKTNIVSKRTIQQYGSIRKKDDLNSAIAELQELGRVRYIETGKRKEIVINPKLLGVV